MSSASSVSGLLRLQDTSRSRTPRAGLSTTSAMFVRQPSSQQACEYTPAEAPGIGSAFRRALLPETGLMTHAMHDMLHCPHCGEETQSVSRLHTQGCSSSSPPSSLMSILNSLFSPGLGLDILLKACSTLNTFSASWGLMEPLPGSMSCRAMAAGSRDWALKVG